MAKNMTTSFAVSITPKVTIDAVPGEHLQFTVLHEDIRTSLGGSGDVFGTADDLNVNNGENGMTNQWTDGIHTAQSSDTLAIDTDGATTDADLLLIKHTGFLYDATTVSNRSTTPSALTDTIVVTAGAAIIATLANNEAIVLPRPVTDFGVDSVVEDVAVEVTIIGLVS